MKIKKLGIKNIILLSIILILLLLGGTSLAYFGWSSTSEEKDQIVDVTISSGGGECSKLEDNSKLLIPVSAKDKGRVITMKTKQLMGRNATISWTITVNKLKNDESTTDGLKNESFKYELRNKTTGVSYGNGNFADITAQNNIVTLSTTEETLDYNKEYEFVLYLWIDGLNFSNNSLDMTSQYFDIDVACNITPSNTKIESPNYLSAHITNLYTPNDTFEVNSIIYNTDTEDRLVEDIAGNIRYYGSHDIYAEDGTTVIKQIQNYIYFNCDDYNNQNDETCEKWRIIGLFDDKVKLMRGAYIWGFAYDSNYNDELQSNSGENDWTKSSLQRLLNNQYLNNIDEDTIYYNESLTDTTVVNFNKDGRGINDETRPLIAEVPWNLGGGDGTNIYADEMYNKERGVDVYIENSTIWVGKIAIFYGSDFAYSFDYKKIGSATFYDVHLNTSATWIRNKYFIDGSFVTSEVNNCHFYLNPSASNKNNVFNTGATGNLMRKCLLRPVLYLNSNVKLKGGTGTINDPYQLDVK